jgi:hypothetical protein
VSFSGPNRVQSVSVGFDTLTITNILNPPPLLPSFRWDAVTNVSINDSGVMTSHPIEGAATPPTDFFRTNPTEVSVTGVVTDTPLEQAISVLGAIQGIPPQPLGRDNALSQWGLLKTYRAQRRLLTVVGAFFQLDSCWCVSITVNHTATDGASLNVTATFHAVRVAERQLVAAVIDADIQAAGFTAGGSTSSQSTDIGTWTGSTLDEL